jgi:hypothetical protein
MVAIANREGGSPPTSGGRGPEMAPRGFWDRLRKAIHGLVKRDRYEPARHYMRGPGPASSRRSNGTEGNDDV